LYLEVKEECPEVVEVEGIDIAIDAAICLAAGRKNMLANVVFVIALSIESPVDVDTVTRNAEVSAVGIHNI
jgi:hypothetical protein